MNIPKLDDSSRRVLLFILDKGIARGSELQRLTGFSDPAKVIAAVQPLISSQFLMASGVASEPTEISRVNFSVRPSALPRVKLAIEQSVSGDANAGAPVPALAS